MPADLTPTLAAPADRLRHRVIVRTSVRGRGTPRDPHRDHVRLSRAHEPGLTPSRARRAWVLRHLRVPQEWMSNRISVTDMARARGFARSDNSFVLVMPPNCRSMICRPRLDEISGSMMAAPIDRRFFSSYGVECLLVLGAN